MHGGSGGRWECIKLHNELLGRGLGRCMVKRLPDCMVKSGDGQRGPPAQEPQVHVLCSPTPPMLDFCSLRSRGGGLPPSVRAAEASQDHTTAVLVFSQPLTPLPPHLPPAILPHAVCSDGRGQAGGWRGGGAGARCVGASSGGNCRPHHPGRMGIACRSLPQLPLVPVRLPIACRRPPQPPCFPPVRGRWTRAC